MTLPLRKKLPTTVPSIRSQAKELDHTSRRRRAALKRGLWVGLMALATHTTLSTSLQAQTPGWQPNRLPNSSSMQPLANAAASQPGVAPQNSPPASGQAANDSGVVLRWRTSARVGNAPANNTSTTLATQTPAPSSMNSANRLPSSGSVAGVATAGVASAGVVSTGSSLAARALESNTVHPASSQVASSNNPLRAATANHQSRQQPVANAFVPRTTHTVSAGAVRSTTAGVSAVQPANYQAPANGAPGNRGSLSDNAIAPPAFPPAGDNSQLQPPPAIPLQNPPAAGPIPNFPPQSVQPDDLSAPEAPPAPPITPMPQDSEPFAAPPTQDSNPAAPMPEPSNQLREPDGLEGRVPPANDQDYPFKNRNTDDIQSPSDQESAQRARDLEKKKDQPDSSANCESFREKLRSATIQKINLNASPRFGQGMSDDPEKAEKMRLDFAASSEVRDWCDRRGQTIIQGRMIDLINEQVVLDINGVRREIPLRDLCDVDLAYVGKAWHLPVTCGSGYETVPGRSFVPSAMQWKASGLCHKPLYFEEVQLERYGHEIGPVLQPLVSTAHFFGNILVLPYKMGIHPPNECQYALGYYRPGDCAPYMLPPVPISLRGAAVQAGAVVGAAALVP